MAKPHSRWVCQKCGSVQARWLGRCPDCNEWETLVEEKEPAEAARRPSRGTWIPTSEARPLSQVTSGRFDRIAVPLEELNRVLGGGIVPGSAILIGGDPGIGKSTLLLQVSGLLAQGGRRVLYASGEESAQQVRLRADRLGITGDELYILAETNLSQILGHIEHLKPALAVVDSIQSVYLEDLTASSGSISQVREGAAALLRLAKSTQIPIIIVGHVTKAGAIAGPRVLEHIVDAVLYLEGERFHAYRLLRSVKNRFGSTNEVGVFEMSEGGLAEVTNPSQVFLSERLETAPGSAIAVTMEGTRPILVEVQALASPTSLSLPRRTANGIDYNRLLILAAVLNKRVGLGLATQDIFVNVVGGLKVSEPAADLAVAVAIASSYRNQPVASDLAIVGEIGLSGELRSVGQIDKRLREAAKLGFRRCLVPRVMAEQMHGSQGIDVVCAGSLAEALQVALVRGATG
ncbi:MAG TPA: DNA repair protein RadA [Anaerolineae bacterium]|nr:DNA repair protein RadA [Anaerolineae bacterium]HOQ98442.1 DNA repair protein RadA [Anaerolineae bacterium]HPL26725.1 DNA repair protein RadA [Anaerolineae bacterium]